MTIPAAVAVLLEAAVRALAAACVLGVGLRLLRVKNVPAQKAAWGLVLASALAMPLLMRLPWLPAWAAVNVPAPAWPQALHAEPAAAPAAPAAASAADHSAVSSTDGFDGMPEAAQTGTGRYPAPSITVRQFDAPDHGAPRIEAGAVPETAQETVHRSATVSGTNSGKISAPLIGAQSAGGTAGRLLAWAWLLYLGVSAALLLRLLVGLGSSVRLWMEATPLEAGPDCDWPAGLAVRSSRRVASPVNIGSGVVLPTDYVRWDGEKLRVVLAHERSHVRQRDFYLQLLAGLYAALTWFSPLGWWLKRKLSELGEAISDRAGLEAAASPSAYAELLLEFAALPRPTLTGVAMAHSTHLSQRIERLLNDASFRQAFVGSRRALTGLLLVPIALYTATALVRVQAAEMPHAAAALEAARQDPAQAPAQDPGQTAPPAPITGQSHPDQPQVTDQGNGQNTVQTPPAPAPNPDAAPAPNPDAAPAPPSASQDQAPAVAPVPPTPPADAVAPVPPVPPADAVAPVPPLPPDPDGRGYHYHYEYDYDGDAYAIVGDPGSHVRYWGDWDGDRAAEIDKARAMAHGHFLLFRHQGKTFIVDDPAIVAQIEAMDKPMEDLGEQMRDAGKKMRADAAQQREMARQAREAAANIPTPDLSKEMADLDAAVASLQSAGATISRQQLGEIERKIGEVQRKLISVQVKVDLNLSGDLGRLGAEQGKFGEQMGRMGAAMGKLAAENNQKVKAIIDESLKDGKALPVQ